MVNLGFQPLKGSIPEFFGCQELWSALLTIPLPCPFVKFIILLLTPLYNVAGQAQVIEIIKSPVLYATADNVINVNILLVYLKDN